jgi:sortase A
MTPDRGVVDRRPLVLSSSRPSRTRRRAVGGRGRRTARVLSTALVTAGLVVLVDVVLTLVWQEPVSAAYGWVNQQEALDDVSELEEEFRQRLNGDQVLDRSRVARWARELRRRADAGQGIGRIELPDIDVEFAMVEGTDTTSLRKGPGHYPETPLPGEGGTVGVAGHRTTYLAPFRRIDELGRGDRVIVEMPYAGFVYRVERTRIVEPSQVGVIRRVDHERIVLTACHPLYSAAERYAVFAKRIAMR